ncbi:MAG: hypothetical protein R3Y24_16030 [Eubacteriales bacterium]
MDVTNGTNFQITKTMESIESKLDTVQISNNIINDNVLGTCGPEENINCNKPWRIVIRRNVADGGSNN